MPELQLVVSGSSILALQQSRADLSRRMLHYQLPELSLREFIALKHGINLASFDLDSLSRDHVSIALELQKTLTSALKYMKEYFNYGAYPFIMEGEDHYLMKINQLINLIIDYDLPEAKALELSTLGKLKKLLYITSTSVPFQPNIAKLAAQVETSRRRLLEMLHILEQSQLIYNLYSSAYGISLLNKPEKILAKRLSGNNPQSIYTLVTGQSVKIRAQIFNLIQIVSPFPNLQKNFLHNILGPLPRTVIL